MYYIHFLSCSTNICGSTETASKYLTQSVGTELLYLHRGSNYYKRMVYYDTYGKRVGTRYLPPNPVCRYLHYGYTIRYDL